MASAQLASGRCTAAICRICEMKVIKQGYVMSRCAKMREIWRPGQVQQPATGLQSRWSKCHHCGGLSASRTTRLVSLPAMAWRGRRATARIWKSHECFRQWRNFKRAATLRVARRPCRMLRLPQPPATGWCRIAVHTRVARARR